MEVREHSRPRLRHNRDFLLLTGGQVTSLLGSQATGLAVPLLVIFLSRSAFALSVVLVLSVSSNLLFGLVAGAVADRFNRRRLMIAADVLRGLLALAVSVGIWTHTITVASIGVVVVLSGAFATVFNAANASALPNLVEPVDLGRAMSLYQSSLTVVRIVGATLSGLLFGLGHVVPFLTDSVSFGASALSLGEIEGNLQEQDHHPGAPLRDQIREGIAAVLASPRLRSLTLLDAADNLRYSGGYILIVLIARSVGASPIAIGLVFSAAGLGALVGSVLAPRVHRLLPLGRIAVLMIWSEALSFPLYAASHSVVAIAGIAAFESIVDPIFTIGVGTFTAQTTPDALRGRVFASTQLLVDGVAPIGLLLAGVLVSAIGARHTIEVFGAWLVVVALVSSASPTLRRLPRVGVLEATVPA